MFSRQVTVEAVWGTGEGVGVAGDLQGRLGGSAGEGLERGPFFLAVGRVKYGVVHWHRARPQMPLPHLPMGAAVWGGLW